MTEWILDIPDYVKECELWPGSFLETCWKHQCLDRPTLMKYAAKKGEDLPNLTPDERQWVEALQKWWKELINV